MKQCKKCPWRVDVDPRTIPNGYCEKKHRALHRTIARGVGFNSTLNVMACHESPIGKERACTGWLHNQIGAGNNIAARIWAIKNLKEPLHLVGEQHQCFEDTLP